MLYSQFKIEGGRKKQHFHHIIFYYFKKGKNEAEMRPVPGKSGEMGNESQLKKRSSLRSERMDIITQHGSCEGF